MEIFHLRYFLAVAEERNFARAAQKLNIAPSPLSQRIKDLERTFGSTLFERSPRGVALTPRGIELLPMARDVVQRFDDLRSRFAVGGGTTEPVQIGVAPDAPTALRRQMTSVAKAVAPERRLKFRPGVTSELESAVRDGILDLALIHGSASGQEIHSRLLDVQPVGVAVSNELTLAHRPELRLGDLAELAWVTIDHRAAPRIYRNTDALLARHGVMRRIVVSGTNVGDLLDSVLAGEGFALVGLYQGATFKAFVGEPVRILPVSDARLSMPTHLAWRSSAAAPGSWLSKFLDALDSAGAGPGTS